MISEPNPVTFQPRGFRDVHWCAIANEPVILTWQGDVAACALCGMVDEERGPGAERGPVWLSFHAFVCHVVRP